MHRNTVSNARVCLHDDVSMTTNDIVCKPIIMVSNEIVSISFSNWILALSVCAMSARVAPKLFRLMSWKFGEAVRLNEKAA